MDDAPCGRPGFRQWVDKTPDPNWTLMPLTHITKGILAEDIVRDGQINSEGTSNSCPSHVYLFYARPAYRVSGDNAIKVEAACPFCFIFEGILIKQADNIFAFDTGAFANRMYKHILLDEMDVHDFSLGCNSDRPNRLIYRTFRSLEAYVNGDLTKVTHPDQAAEAWEFHARAYLQLIRSPGRNEPDDRICSIEVIFDDPVSLLPSLKAIVVLHTLWNESKQTPWLSTLHEQGVEIRPYLFTPGRHAEHYHTLLEVEVRDLYKEWSIL